MDIELIEYEVNTIMGDCYAYFTNYRPDPKIGLKAGRDYYVKGDSLYCGFEPHGHFERVENDDGTEHYINEYGEIFTEKDIDDWVEVSTEEWLENKISELKDKLKFEPIEHLFSHKGGLTYIVPRCGVNEQLLYPPSMRIVK